MFTVYNLCSGYLNWTGFVGGNCIYSSYMIQLYFMEYVDQNSVQLKPGEPWLFYWIISLVCNMWVGNMLPLFIYPLKKVRQQTLTPNTPKKTAAHARRSSRRDACDAALIIIAARLTPINKTAERARRSPSSFASFGAIFISNYGHFLGAITARAAPQNRPNTRHCSSLCAFA